MSFRRNKLPLSSGGRARDAREGDSYQTVLVFSAAALTIVLFALTATTTRIVVKQINGFDAGLIRAVGAGLFAIPLIAICRFRPPRGMAGWGLLLTSAFCSFAAFPVLFSLGAERTSASHAGLLMGTLPLFTGGIGMVVERRAPPLFWAVGACVAMSGEAALVLLRTPGVHVHATILGDMLVAASLILCSGGFVAGAQLANRISSWAATFWGIGVAAVTLAPLAAVRIADVNWSLLTPTTWTALFHLTFGANILAYVSWFWALSRGGIARVAVLQFLQPAVAVLFAVVLLGEQLTLPIAAAMVTIVAGIIIARRRSQAVIGLRQRRREVEAALDFDSDRRSRGT